MIHVDIQEAMSRFSAIMAAVEERGEWVLICRNGKPVAELRPPSPIDPLQCHPELRGIQFNEDPILPLSPEDWPEAA